MRSNCSGDFIVCGLWSLVQHSSRCEKMRKSGVVRRVCPPAPWSIWCWVVRDLRSILPESTTGLLGWRASGGGFDHGPPWLESFWGRILWSIPPESITCLLGWRASGAGFCGRFRRIRPQASLVGELLGTHSTTGLPGWRASGARFDHRVCPGTLSFMLTHTFGNVGVRDTGCVTRETCLVM